MSETGLGLRFKVEINGTAQEWSLGEWTKVEGLTVEYDIHEYREGGQNGFVHRLPGRAKYQNIKLTRPLTKASADVAEWVSDVASVQSSTTATITVLDASEEVTALTLHGAFPASERPTLDVGTNNGDRGSELAHTGFPEPARWPTAR
jgi:phage tail-like protein